MKVYVKGSGLKRSILRSGYNLTSFAEEISISRTYLSSIVNSHKNLSPDLAMKIATKLNVNFNELFFVGTAEEYERWKGMKNHV